MAYRCEQCGSPEIAALSQLYEQGTRSFSGRFTSGVSQSYSARAAAPPKPKRYFRPIILWGPVVVFFGMWTYVGFNTLFMHPKAFVLKEFLAVVFFLLFIAALARLLVNLGRVTRYNREVDVYKRQAQQGAESSVKDRPGIPDKHVLDIGLGDTVRPTQG